MLISFIFGIAPSICTSLIFSIDDFNKYLEECKKKGFNLESKTNNDSYDAFIL